MFYHFFILVAGFAAISKAEKFNVAGNSTLGICGYSATCSAGGTNGVCVSVGSGCCNGGTATSGLCPGNV